MKNALLDNFETKTILLLLRVITRVTATYDKYNFHWHEFTGGRTFNINYESNLFQDGLHLQRDRLTLTKGHFQS